MVDGVNGNFKPLKLKGAESKSINLNQLDGLKKTNQNKSIFEGKIDLNGDGKVDENDVLDKNGNGVIDGEEVGILQKFLDKLGGRDHKASAKDFHLKDKADNQTAFNSLDKLAKQQIAKMNGQDYVEENGDTTTIIKPDGVTIVATKVGDEIKVTTTSPDGTRQESSIVDGKTTSVTYSPGSDVPFTKVVSDQDGNILSCETYEYNGDEKTTRKYENGNVVTGTLTGITVENKQNIEADGVLGLPEGEAQVSTEFKTEDDKTNNKPESQTYTIDGKEYTVNYEYAEDGTITAKIQTEGEEPREVKCKRGEDGQLEKIGDEELTKPEEEATEYEVKSGDNLWNIAKAHLGEGASAKDIANYVNKIMEANPDLKWDSSHTKVMIHAGDKINLPAVEKKEGEEDVKPTEEETETEAPGEETTTQYDVKSGDNLWNIAKAHLGEGASAKDIANYVDKIMEANPSLSWDSSHTKVMIRPGDKITLPSTDAAGKKPEVTTHEDKYKLDSDSVYTGITDETKKEAYKTFMTEWKEGDTISFGEGDDKKDYTKVTQEDGTRVFAQGVHHYGITADLGVGEEIWTDDATVTIGDKTYTRKTEGGIHYLELDGEKCGIDDSGQPFQLEDGKEVNIGGKTYTIKKDGDEFYFEDADGKKYNITSQIGVGEEITAE